MDVQEEIYQAIDNMVGRRLERQNLTTQSEGIVVGASVKGDGMYHVKINGATYKVRDGIGLRPNINDIVWVCIPNNDWGKAYICGGRRFDGGDPPVQNYVEANPTSLATDALTKLRVNKTTYEIPRDVRDVKQNGTSVVTNHIANITAPEDVVDEQGHSLINEFNQAVIPTVASGVNDVLVDGTSVVTDHTARITMPTIPVMDVKVNNVSVVSGKIANVVVPTIEANPSQSATSTLTKLKVDNTVYNVSSGGSSTLAGLTDTDINTPTDGQYLTYNATSSKWVNTTGGGGGTTVIANPSGIATDDLEKVQIGNTIYDIPGSGSGGQHYTCDLLFENDPLPSPTSGTSNITRSYTLNNSIDNYDAVYVTSYAYHQSPNGEGNILSSFILKENYYLAGFDGNGEMDNASTNSYRRSIFYTFTDDTHLTTVAVRSESGIEPILYKVYGIKWAASIVNNPVYLSDIYSTTERQVGYWIDGKPLYQKTIHFEPRKILNSGNNNQIMQLPSEMVIVNNVATDTDNSYVQDLIQIGKDSNNYLRIYNAKDEAIGLRDLTLQYIKTTDTPEQNPTVGNLIYLPTIYSENERQIGVWTDGKPVYQRVKYVSGPWPGGTTDGLVFDLSEWNVERVCFSDFVMGPSTDSPISYAHPYVNNNNVAYAVGINIAADRKVYINVGNNSYVTGVRMIIQYTKTTDQPGSAFPNISWPVTDVLVNGTSVLDGTIAKISNTGGSTVTVTPIQLTGTKIATISVDSDDYDIYAPEGGGTGDVSDVYVNGQSVLDTNHIAQIDLSGYQTNLQSEIDKIYNVCVSMGSTPPSHGFADVLLTALYTIGGGKKYVDVDSTSTTNMRYFGHAKEVD